MEQLKVTEYDLTQICRLCLSCDANKSDIFLYSADLEKKIADVIMECVPIQITKHDKMPTNICRLCFTQLKTFHQFQMQAVQSDRTLQRFLQQQSDCHKQIKVEWSPEEPSIYSVNQNCSANVSTKCEPIEISDGFDIFYSKEKVPANFSAVKKTIEEIFLKSEIKDEPIDDNSLIPAECADTVGALSKGGNSAISCEDLIGIGESKVSAGTPGNFKFENYITENIPVKPDETHIPLKDSEYVCSNDDNLIRTEHPSKSQNFNEKFDVCKKLFKKSAGKSNQCEICQMCFSHSYQLKKHKLEHSGDKPYRCDICQKQFTQISCLNIHKLMHTGEKPYQCEICKRCFSVPGNLKKHNLIHTGEKPYQCEICKKCFSVSSNLKKHTLIHTGEKPYQCDVCKMCFSLSGNLKKHNLIHTGEKPYQCDVCRMCFRRTDSLKDHKLLHTGEKPYQCDVCNMYFKRTDSLKDHKLKHTGEKPYQCDVCKMCFRYLRHLKKHELKHTEGNHASVKFVK